VFPLLDGFYFLKNSKEIVYGYSKMSLIDNLANYLDKENPFPALNLLESALVCSRMTGHAVIPMELINDLNSLFEPNIIEIETKGLSNINVFEKIENSFMLNPDMFDFVSGLLNQYKKNLQLSLNGPEETAESFISKLVSYLTDEVREITLTESIDGLVYQIGWQGKNYRLQIALSPAWLPAVAEDLAGDQVYLALFGPFAAQNWNIMHKYYSYPEFRNFTALFDPWYRQKMNISRGGLFAYFDCFFRDVYGLKFFIPEKFPSALQELGLLRYNDER
jgi:hypothetical protein